MHDSENTPDSLPTVFAVVIGINKYNDPDYLNLAAAVNDANDFEDFLRGQLKVPKENIISLRDEDATRVNIIDAFIQLCDNANIKKDETAIIIYYAGHGTQVDKPAEWSDWFTPSGRIEMLCPSDLGMKKTNSAGEDKVVEGIHDRTISALLNRMSSLKGDNITLVLDCCHSAGISRTTTAENGPDDGYIARYLPNPPSLSANCDQEIWGQGTGSLGTRSTSVAKGFSGKDRASHVLLAACGREQNALEDSRNNRGLFTEALLQVLNGSSLTDLTYTSLMHKLKLPTKKQAPHCEGHNINRRLFNRSALGADPSFILAKQELDGVIVLQAGLAHGITPKSTFTAHASNLFPNMSYANPDMGYLIATSQVGPLESVLEVAPGSELSELPQLFYCRVMALAEREISVYSNDRNWLESVFPYEKQASLSVTIADSPIRADLEMITEDGKVLLYRNDPLINKYIDREFPYVLDMRSPALIHKVVQAALIFTHNFTLNGDDMANVWMELKKLKEVHNGSHGETLTPDGTNMLEKEPTTITVDESERFGMTICNQTDLAFYPHLFYFDPSDFSITEWYVPSLVTGACRRLDAPLQPTSQLAIGYGDSGVAPWQFLLRPGDKKDVGFFKLILTTGTTNLSNICQQTPFETGGARLGKPMAVGRLRAGRWVTMMSTVAQVAPS